MDRCLRNFLCTKSYVYINTFRYKKEYLPSTFSRTLWVCPELFEISFRPNMVDKHHFKTKLRSQHKWRYVLISPTNILSLIVTFCKRYGGFLRMGTPFFSQKVYNKKNCLSKSEFFILYSINMFQRYFWKKSRNVYHAKRL